MVEATAFAETPQGSALMNLNWTTHRGGAHCRNESRTGLILNHSLRWVEQ